MNKNKRRITRLENEVTELKRQILFTSANSKQYLNNLFEHYEDHLINKYFNTYVSIHQDYISIQTKLPLNLNQMNKIIIKTRYKKYMIEFNSIRVLNDDDSEIEYSEESL